MASVPLPAAQAAVLPCPQLSRGDILTATNTHAAAAAAAAAGRHSTLMVSITVQAQNSYILVHMLRNKLFYWHFFPRILFFSKQLITFF